MAKTRRSRFGGMGFCWDFFLCFFLVLVPKLLDYYMVGGFENPTPFEFLHVYLEKK